MRPRWWHPGSAKLRMWLEDGDEKLDAHIATCERCATRLEDLSEPAVPLGDALRALLAPPVDLQPRLQAGITLKMQTRDDLRLLCEMMGLPAIRCEH